MTLTPAQEYVGTGQTASELARAIGKTGLYQVDEIQFPVKVMDVVVHWGRPKFLITPIGGQGSKWVIERLSLLEGQNGE